MATDMQNFDLFDMDSNEGDKPASEPEAASPEELTVIISQIIDANEEAACTLDFSRADHREYFAGTIAHAMLYHYGSRPGPPTK